jgi:hypothetical protein
VNDRPGKLALSILATLIVLLAIGNIATRSHAPRPSVTAHPSGTAPAPEQGQSTAADPIPAPTPPTPRSEIQGQDRYYLTRQFRDYERRQQIARPAYQHLPYRTSQVRIDITNVTSDGRIVLTVTPLGPNVSPRAEYQAFLARYHDPGSAYLAVLARYDP